MFKRYCLIFLLIILLTFTSCASVGFNNTDTMRPPKATGEKAEIQNAIEKAIGSDYTLKYPQNGEYRSAVIMYDLNYDSDEEVIVFYSINNAEVAGMNMLIIDKINNAFKAIANFTVAAAEADRVNILDLNNDGNIEILVGWSMYSSQLKKLTAYSFANNSVNELICDESYNEMITTDLNDDKVNEIILFTLGSTEVSGNAKLLKVGDSATTLYPASTVIMNSDVVTYLKLQSAKINNDKYGLIVDGLLVDSSLETQVIYLNDNGVLENPLFSKEDSNVITNNTNLTKRDSKILSMDINGDGITEIPVAGRLHADSLKDGETLCNVYDWCFMNSVTLTLDSTMTTVSDGNNSYWFIVPALWKNKYTAIYNIEEKSITFKKHDTSAIIPNENTDMDTVSLNEETAIMKIRVFKENDWKNNDDGYISILKSGDNIYAYKFFLLEDDEMYLTGKQIRNNFILQSYVN